jgi:hypothetical protein
VKDQPSTSDDETPERYGPEYWAHFLDDLDEDDLRGEGPHLISVDELRDAGALDVPAAWRKSLGEEPRFLLPGFDDEQDADSQPSPRADSEDDESSNI